MARNDLQSQRRVALHVEMIHWAENVVGVCGLLRRVSDLLRKLIAAPQDVRAIVAGIADGGRRGGAIEEKTPRRDAADGEAAAAGGISRRPGQGQDGEAGCEYEHPNDRTLVPAS